MHHRRLIPLAFAVMLSAGVTLSASLATLSPGLSENAQRRGAAPAPPARRPPALLPAKTVAPQFVCPAPLGAGVNSNRMYCDVLTGTTPADGVVISLPAHAGPITLTFDLHNRYIYSEEQVQAKPAFARYTATIGALTADNTLISRAAIQSEFRTAADLVDRIGGGAGPTGLKAVAPTGVEHVTLTIPEEENQVSLLGEKVTVDRAEGSATYSSTGRPVAIVSNIMIEYHPAPATPAPAARGRGRGL